MKNRIIFSFVFASLLIAGSAVADETYRCTFGQQERVISVVYLEPDQEVPCEVRYEKDGTTETLWTAENEIGYCEEKARDFVEQQRAWGWICLETEQGTVQE